MQQDATVAAAVEIVDAALDDLTGLGITSNERAAALLSAGLAELRDELDDLAATEIYRFVLAEICDGLQARQSSIRGARH